MQRKSLYQDIRKIREDMTQPEIIYEDEAILVCHKPAGVATQTKRLGQKDMESILKNYIVGKKTCGRQHTATLYWNCSPVRPAG